MNTRKYLRIAVPSSRCQNAIINIGKTMIINILNTSRVSLNENFTELTKLANVMAVTNLANSAGCIAMGPKESQESEPRTELPTKGVISKMTMVKAYKK